LNSSIDHECRLKALGPTFDVVLDSARSGWLAARDDCLCSRHGDGRNDAASALHHYPHRFHARNCCEAKVKECASGAFSRNKKSKLEPNGCDKPDRAARKSGGNLEV
jgi:hypothetical protein